MTVSNLTFSIRGFGGKRPSTKKVTYLPAVEWEAIVEVDSNGNPRHVDSTLITRGVPKDLDSIIEKAKEELRVLLNK